MAKPSGIEDDILLCLGAFVAAIRAGPRGVRNVSFAAALGGFLAQGMFDYLFFDISLVVFFVAMVWGATRPVEPPPAEAVSRRSGMPSVDRVQPVNHPA